MQSFQKRLRPEHERVEAPPHGRVTLGPEGALSAAWRPGEK
jgi:hypothetical protein